MEALTVAGNPPREIRSVCVTVRWTLRAGAARLQTIPVCIILHFKMRPNPHLWAIQFRKYHDQTHSMNYFAIVDRLTRLVPQSQLNIVFHPLKL